MSQEKIDHAKLTAEYPRYSDVFSLNPTLTETERNMLMVCVCVCVCVRENYAIFYPFFMLSFTFPSLSFSLPPSLPLPGPLPLHEPKSLHHFQGGSSATCLQPLPHHGLATPPSPAGVWNSEQWKGKKENSLIFIFFL